MKIISILLLSFILEIIILVWGINKGFDFTDEGYYILGYQQGQEIGFCVSFFHLIIRKVFAWLSLDVIDTRSIRLVLTILSSLFFSIGLWQWIGTIDLISWLF